MIPPQFYRCHCQAFLRQYAYITEKNHVFKVCPYCKCRVQKLEYRIRLDQTIGRWIKLPITACPSDEILPKDYRIYIVHTPLYKPYDAQRIAPPLDTHEIRHIQQLLMNRWKLRKKQINGRLYAYAQRGTVYQYLGPWKSEYQDLLKSNNYVRN
jgi:hypothetical protein